MTPEFAAGFNAGIAAARNAAKLVADKYKSYADEHMREGRGVPASVCEDTERGELLAINEISALTVPSDLVAVPREPDTDICIAAHMKLEEELGVPVTKSVMEAVYRAMIAATEERR